MAVRLSDMRAKVTETFLTWDGERVDFAYKPNEFTMDLADDIEKAAEREDVNVVSMLLSPIVVWWDVLDDNDERIPASPENMGKFPMNFLLKIMKAITEDQDPEAKGSAGG